jgi:hypothetical protein
LQHPAVIVCPTCLDSELDWTPIDGQGVVVGCTVNRQLWIPSFPPPYVLAIVELVGAPGVRLTTNIVKCDVEDVYVGLPVRVTFEQQDDVWFPLFEPDPAVQGDQPAAAPVPQPRPRPMVTTTKFEDRVAITGIGMSQVGRRLMRPAVSLTVEACRAAVEDAGLTMDDIDGLSTYPGGMAAAHGISEGGIPVVEEALRITPVRPAWAWVAGSAATCSGASRSAARARQPGSRCTPRSTSRSSGAGARRSARSPSTLAPTRPATRTRSTATR